MKLRTLPDAMNLRGKRALLRLDWNVPLSNVSPLPLPRGSERGFALAAEDTVKIERSLGTIRSLASRGAIVIVLTHLGRPEGRDPSLSTLQLVDVLERRFRLSIAYHPESVSEKKEREALALRLAQAKDGSIHLLENVRFEQGEEKNDPQLAKAYASLGDLFVNDAFASSHRSHASVVGIAKLLPRYAGPQLVEEVRALSVFLKKPKKPFVVVIGGLKLSTKIPIIKSLLLMCDRLLIGGAMATTLRASLKDPVGKSFVEKSVLKDAKAIAEHPKVYIPYDVVVTKKIEEKPKLERKLMIDIKSDDRIVDVGPRTLRGWGEEILRAQTILWNGPVGITEIPACGAGTRFLARAVGMRAKGKAFGVVGGGDTLPVIYATKTENQFDHVSMGGGALLEFLEKKGKLPGLLPLMT